MLLHILILTNFNEPWNRSVTLLFCSAAPSWQNKQIGCTHNALLAKKVALLTRSRRHTQPDESPLFLLFACWLHKVLRLEQRMKAPFFTGPRTCLHNSMCRLCVVWMFWTHACSLMHSFYWCCLLLRLHCATPPRLIMHSLAQFMYHAWNAP